MKSILKKLQSKSGFISIEAVILWGLTIALGAWAWAKFYEKSEILIDHAIEINATTMDVKVSEE